MATTGNVFAYNRNQATASTNDCENGQMATNVGCQNIGSQIQGDGNSVALAAQQTFPASEPTPPPPSTGFTVIGSGSTTGASVECTPPVLRTWKFLLSSRHRVMEMLLEPHWLHTRGGYYRWNYRWKHVFPKRYDI